MNKNTMHKGKPMHRIVLIAALLLTAGLAHAGSATRTSSFAYDPNTGLLIQEIIEPDTPALRLQTDYQYDAYGNKVSVTVSGADIVTRTTTTTYDSNGQFPVTASNALNQSETRGFDARFGGAASLTGPNGLTTTWSYDGFGRKVNETRADGTQTNIEYRPCDGSCPYNGKYYTVTTTSGAPTSYAYYDMLNRKLREQAQGFDGRLVTKDTEYDSRGRVSRTSRPYYAGEAVYWVSVTYDQINRVIQETSPDGSTKTISYNGLTTTVTNALGQTETKTKNSQGQLASVTDAQGNVLAYQYDPFGNLIKTTDPKGNVTTLTYDLRGRKVGMNDPDMGAWSYQYNVLGELVQQTNAKNQTTTMVYDKLGRLTQRTEPDLISTWTYDTATKGVGKLAKVTADNGFQRTYTYDSLGRVVSETSTIDTIYVVSKTYDAYGRVDTFTYPTGFTVANVYNAQGYLAEVKAPGSSSTSTSMGVTYWKATAKDAEGHLLNETLGNGLTTTRTYTAATGRIETIASGANGIVQNQRLYFDVMGNLTARYDPSQGQSESFAYDTLNRLTVSTGSRGTVTLTYDSIGNISNKSDAGDYLYGARPHAVAQVTGAINATYTYDANGNLISGAGRSVIYTSYNLPSQVVAPGGTVNFIYDADHTRIKQVTSSETLIYLNPRIDLGGHFEKEIKGGVTEYKHYIYGGAGVVAIYTTKSGAIPTTRYLHQDHLGSIVAVTDESGGVVARYAYDAWGKRIPLAGDAKATHHGFTGHEHLEGVGLIHMNGRVYDPVLARFMSADPYVQAPGNLQSYNRYSYVWNNPLAATDPSGYFRLGKVARFAVAIAAAYFTGGYLTNLAWQTAATQAISVGTLNAMTLGAAMAGGFVGGAIMTGTVQGGVQGALSAGLFYGAGELGGVPGGAQKVFSHAAAGCLSSMAGGGKCGSGALSAGFAEFAGPRIPTDSFVADLVKHSVLGGVGSTLGGGKFSNGAMTGAYGYLFNCGMHPGCWARVAQGIQSLWGRLQVAVGNTLQTSWGQAAYDLAAGEVGAPMAAGGGKIAVLGHYDLHDPNYLQVAKEVGGHAFYIPSSLYKDLAPGVGHEWNYRFLDWVVQQGYEIRLSGPLMKSDSMFARELNYLRDKHFLVPDSSGSRLVPMSDLIPK